MNFSNPQDDRSWIEINLDHFSHNIQQLLKFIPKGKGFLQIVKADAYGHGAGQIASIAINKGAKLLGVANSEEGLMLRYVGIKAPILILSPSLISEIDEILEYDLVPSVANLHFAKALNEKASTLNKICPIHIKVDSGMNRNGVKASALLSFYSQLMSFANLHIEGIFSHFAASEDDTNFTMQQASVFEEAIKKLPCLPNYIHIANSTASVLYQFPFTNLVRIGLLSYGVPTTNALPEGLDLLPVMTFKSRISHISNASPNDSIGYNRTFQTNTSLSYALVPIGYADGYDFLLSNLGKVLIRNTLCPVIGKISMDMTAIDITSNPDICLGDEVTLLGEGHPSLHFDSVASLYRGSAYELLCQIGRRARRYYTLKGKLHEATPLLRREFIPKDFTSDKLGKIIRSAIAERLGQDEIATVIYQDILRYFFHDNDQKTHYRSHFIHTIEFSESNDPQLSDYYITKTTLQFKKVLQDVSFTIACANDDTKLQFYFMKKGVEYRWLLDSNFELSENFFRITSATINQRPLEVSSTNCNGCIEFQCTNPSLKNLIGKEVEFFIETLTYYPRKSHQLSVYITEITRGVEIQFIYPDCINQVEISPIFSGRNKFPLLEHKKNTIRVSSSSNEWIFPNSGVVFSY